MWLPFCKEDGICSGLKLNWGHKGRGGAQGTTKPSMQLVFLPISRRPHSAYEPFSYLHQLKRESLMEDAIDLRTARELMGAYLRVSSLDCFIEVGAEWGDHPGIV